MERVYLFGGKAAVGEDIFVLAALNIPPKAVCPLDAACAMIVIADKAADKAQVALRHEHIPVLVGYAGRDADIDNFSIKIADLTVDISCTHLHLSDVCSEYLTDEAPLFSVGADEEHKEELRKFFLVSSQVFSDAFLESIAVQEKICAAVLDYDAAVFHAALIAFDGQGVAFAAPSGTGKTTHIKLWQRLYGDRVEIINGDKPLFTLRSGRFFASGMPWCGKENWGCNKTVPLKAICFIDRAEQNSISRLEDNREIMSRLFLQLVMPEEHRLMVKYLDFANKLINTVPFYLLRCNMELSAAQTAHDGVFGIE